LRGELPLTLAYLFPEIEACRSLHDGARQVLSQGLDELLDGEGVLHAVEWSSSRRLLASWTRCRVLGGELKKGCWNAAAEKQFPRFVREVLRHARPNGEMIFGAAGANDAELLDTAVRVTHDRKTAQLAARVQRRRTLDYKAEKRRFGKAAVNSEWAQSALLRTSWAKDSPRLGVLYSDKAVRTEFSNGRDVAFSGIWDLQVAVNG